MKRMRRKGCCGLLTVFLAAGLFGPEGALAGDEKNWSLNLDAGIEYDDNLTVEEQDLVSDQSDSAAVFELDGVYRFGEAVPLRPEISYNFYQSFYDDYSTYDMQSHTLSLAGEREYGEATAGLDYSYAYMTLDSDGFLQTHSLTPSIGYSFAPEIYLYASYILMDKDFRQSANNPRDAVNNSLGADLFYFFNGNATDFCQLGYRYEDENATGSEYEYQGHGIRAALQMMLPYDLKMRLVYRYHLKDYRNITPSIGAEREDTKNAIRLTLTRPVYEKLSVKVDYQHLDNDSNLPSNDYSENIVYAGIILTL